MIIGNSRHQKKRLKRMSVYIVVILVTKPIVQLNANDMISNKELAEFWNHGINPITGWKSEPWSVYGDNPVENEEEYA